MMGFARNPLPALAAAVAVTLVGGALAAPVRAAQPTFSTPAATYSITGPTVFTTTITTDSQPARVELLLDFPGSSVTDVISADLVGTNGSWTAQATFADHILPNSPLTYGFRLTDSSGAQFLGPQAQLLTADNRYSWKTVSGPIVRLHWNGGDDSFGQRALAIGEQAIANASKLLGVTETTPIDFFIYDDEQAFRDALGPGTRENVAGTAIPEIRTMFGFILPSQINEDWVRVLITHELTHLVFDTATKNIYHQPPHWLNEGIAVYLSEGISARWQAALAAGISDGSLIPLQGMNATFGAGDQRFELGYAEGVSAVDYFVRTYTQEKLWALVRSYSQGLTDDDAFRGAIGLDVAGFNGAWMQSLGVSVPAELGPKPGPTGPLPPEWLGLPAPTPGASSGQTPGSVRPTPRPTQAGGAAPTLPTDQPFGPIAGSITVIVLAFVVVAWFFIRRRRRPAVTQWLTPAPFPPPEPPGPPGPHGVATPPPTPPPPTDPDNDRLVT